MIKQKILLIILMCIVSYSYAQLTKYYSVTIKKSDENYYGSFRSYSYDIEFFLCKDGNYEMRLDENYASTIDDHVMYYFISYGKYVIKNDTLILTDSYTHHQMMFKFDNSYAELFEKDNIYMEPVKTFPFLMDKVFTDWEQLHHTHYNVECGEMFGNVPIEIEEKISNFRKESTQAIPLEIGKYWFGSYVIELTDENKYEIHLYFDLCDSQNSTDSLILLFFTGKWERDGNILTLWDTNFEHQFYGLIREDGIELLLFRWQDVIFRKDFY